LKVPVSSYKRPEDSPVKQVLDKPEFAPAMMKPTFERGDLIVLFLAAKSLLEMSMIFTYLP
jgi:hypothetical protein